MFLYEVDDLLEEVLVYASEYTNNKKINDFIYYFLLDMFGEFIDKIQNEERYREQYIRKIDHTNKHKSSWWYRNCLIQRRRNSECCKTCPFKKIIEEW